MLERHGTQAAASANRGLPVNPGAVCKDLEKESITEATQNTKEVAFPACPVERYALCLPLRAARWQYQGTRWETLPEFFAPFVFFVASVIRSSALMVLLAPWRRLPAAVVSHQTMKAFLPIFVRFAFIVFFASIVVAESLRS
jgi:hypothetical protein